MRRRMSQSEFNGIYGGLFVLLFLLLAFVYVVGFWPAAVILLIVAGFFGAKVFSDIGGTRRAQDQEERAPCQHGVAYAKRSSEKCPQCVALKAQCEETERQQQALEDERYERERARQEREFAESLRREEFLRRMDPVEFERLVCRLYSKMGYEVKTTPKTGDQGADGFLSKDGAKFILQCKRVQGSVGQPILRDLLGTITHFECQGGIVVTTGAVSSAAREWARGKPIELVELDELQALLQAYYGRLDGKMETAPSEGKAFWKWSDDPGIDAAVEAFSASVPSEAGTPNFSMANDPDIENALAIFAKEMADEQKIGGKSLE